MSGQEKRTADEIKIELQDSAAEESHVWDHVECLTSMLIHFIIAQDYRWHGFTSDTRRASSGIHADPCRFRWGWRDDRMSNVITWSESSRIPVVYCRVRSVKQDDAEISQEILWRACSWFHAVTFAQCDGMTKELICSAPSLISADGLCHASCGHKIAWMTPELNWSASWCNHADPCRDRSMRWRKDARALVKCIHQVPYLFTTFFFSVPQNDRSGHVCCVLKDSLSCVPCSLSVTGWQIRSREPYFQEFKLILLTFAQAHTGRKVNFHGTGHLCFHLPWVFFCTESLTLHSFEVVSAQHRISSFESTNALHRLNFGRRSAISELQADLIFKESFSCRSHATSLQRIKSLPKSRPACHQMLLFRHSALDPKTCPFSAYLSSKFSDDRPAVRLDDEDDDSCRHHSSKFSDGRSIICLYDESDGAGCQLSVNHSGDLCKAEKIDFDVWNCGFCARQLLGIRSCTFGNREMVSSAQHRVPSFTLLAPDLVCLAITQSSWLWRIQHGRAWIIHMALTITVTEPSFWWRILSAQRQLHVHIGCWAQNSFLPSARNCVLLIFEWACTCILRECSSIMSQELQHLNALWTSASMYA